MTNEVLSQLAARKSVRAYEPIPVAPEARSAILNAALWAPTAGNMALYTILEITDPALKARLSETCDHQPFIAQAPMVLVFVADYQKWYDAFTARCDPEARMPSTGDFLLAYADAMIAAQNAVVAAESLGVGSCYIGDIIERMEEHQRLLNLPRFTVPVAMLCMGYPTQQQRQRQKPPRKDLGYMVCENAYRRLSAEELMDMYGEEQVDKLYHRKWLNPFIEEMTRSAKAWLERWG